MARENKKNRGARWFGRPERLADRIWSPELKLGRPAYLGGDELTNHGRRVAVIMAAIAESTVMNTDNVVEFFYNSTLADEFDWTKDIPCWLPPFEKTFFEASRPASIHAGAEVPGDFPARWGWFAMLMTPIEVIGEPDDRGRRTWRARAALGGQDYLGYCYNWPDHKYVLFLSLVEESPKGWIDIDECSMLVALDETGRTVHEPEFCLTNHEHWNKAAITAAKERARLLAAPILLSLTFLNWKGVTVAASEPDPNINRKRRKAKLRPFVRFHTIDITPAAKVLRGEGASESGGLKRALHKVRGHICLMTKNNKGEPLPKPVIYPRREHERGNPEHGIIISDYRVNPPAPTEPPTPSESPEAQR